MKIEYAIENDGGFIAIVRSEKLAYYAYPSSDNAVKFANAKLRGKFLPDTIRRQIDFNRNHPYQERYDHLLREMLSRPAISRGALEIA